MPVIEQTYHVKFNPLFFINADNVQTFIKFKQCKSEIYLSYEDAATGGIEIMLDNFHCDNYDFFTDCAYLGTNAGRLPGLTGTLADIGEGLDAILAPSSSIGYNASAKYLGFKMYTGQTNKYEVDDFKAILPCFTIKPFEIITSSANL